MDLKQMAIIGGVVLGTAVVGTIVGNEINQRWIRKPVTKEEFEKAMKGLGLEVKEEPKKS